MIEKPGNKPMIYQHLEVLKKGKEINVVNKREENKRWNNMKVAIDVCKILKIEDSNNNNNNKSTMKKKRRKKLRIHKKQLLENNNKECNSKWLKIKI